MPNIKEFLNNLWPHEKYLAYVIIASLILAYAIPPLLMPRPFDTDAYTHLEYTRLIKSTDSIYDFYKLLQEKNSQNDLGFSGYFNYPFGLWLFGSLVSKMTGIDPFVLTYTLPLIILVITIATFYVYSKNFLDRRDHKMLAVLFLLSMPVVSTFLLSYRPSVFVLPPILCALLAMKPVDKGSRWKRLPLVAMSLFVICLSHTGSFMFIMLFTLAYIMVYAAIWGKAQKDMYANLVMTMLVYTLTVSLFPIILPQYTVKSTLVLTTGDFISSKTHIGYVAQLSRIFYDEVFANSSLVNTVIWSAFIYGVIALIIHLRGRISLESLKNRKAGLMELPLIGGAMKITHSVVATPFWLGPIHSFLTIPGFFRINTEGKCALITILIVTLLPGALVTGSTGAIREIYYALVIIPVTSALGFYWLMEAVEKIKRRRMRNALRTTIVFGLLVSFAAVPMIGNIYFLPDSAGRDYEINSMKWLSGYGTGNEKSVGPGYRQLIAFTKKEIVDTEYGTEARNLIKDLQEVYLENGSESYASDLHSTFGADYVITSKRVMDNFASSLDKARIDNNTLLDRLYSCKDFGIYSFNKEKKDAVPKAGAYYEPVVYEEDTPVIQDKISTYFIETPTYKVNIEKDRPQVKYFGDDEDDLLGGGYVVDYVLLSWYAGPYNEKLTARLLKDLQYTVVEPRPNQLVYTSSLTGPNLNETWASISIKYTFYEKAVKKEIIIANDELSFPSDSLLSVTYTNMQFSPLPEIYYSLDNGTESRKNVYPSDDEVQIRGVSFNRVFFSDGTKGIYTLYDDTGPYPSEMVYQGSTSIKYSSKNVKVSSFLSPADSMHVTAYMSLGDKETARNNVEQYVRVSLYPYRNGRPPFSVLSYIESPDTLSEEGYRNIYNAHEVLGVNQSVEYSEALPYKDTDANRELIYKLKDYNANIFSYVKPLDDAYRPPETQRKDINDALAQAADYNASKEGVITRGLEGNLDTIKALDDAHAGYALVRAPDAMFSGEGYRIPRMAYYQGRETDTVLLPIVQPDSSSLREGGRIDDVYSAWNKTIGYSVKGDAAALFLWQSTDVGKPQYIEKVSDLAAYANSSGLVSEKPSEIASHYSMLRNVTAVVKGEWDSVVIEINNRNALPVKGLSYVVVMPSIKSECPYKASNARLERSVAVGQSCRCYISTDIEAMGQKEISIEPSVQKNKFTVSVVNGHYEGTTTLSVRGTDGRPIQSASVTVDSSKHLTDENGIVKVTLRRGAYTVTVEKPGYESMTYDLRVLGRIYSYASMPEAKYVIAGAALICVLATGASVFKRRKTQGEKG